MSLRSAESPRRTLPYVGLLIAVFAYLFYVRTRAVTDSFLLLYDQIRDWRFALGPFSALPLTGPQSTAGGVSLGPIYYWVLWVSRRVIGPWVDNLPHAGAYGISLFQGAADILLLDTLRVWLGSTWAAVAAVLLAATASHDLAISATIWNPAVSVAFVKIAIALRLRRAEDPSLWWTAATTAAAWCAVQAHSAAVFVAVPIVASYVLGDIGRRRTMRVLQQLRTIVEVIVLLQLPFLGYAFTQSSSAAPTRALGGASEALASGNLRLMVSARAVLSFVSSILTTPWVVRAGPALLVVAALVVVIRARRSLAMTSVTVGPLVTTALGLALWQGNYDEYWYLPLVPCASVALVYALTWWRPAVTGAVVLAAVLVVQPGRLAHSLTWYRMPEYRPTVVGATRIVRQTRVLRRLDTTFRMPPFSDATFPYRVLGGTFSDAAEFDALIDRDGNVTFRPVR